MMFAATCRSSLSVTSKKIKTFLFLGIFIHVCITSWPIVHCLVWNGVTFIATEMVLDSKDGRNYQARVQGGWIL